MNVAATLGFSLVCWGVFLYLFHKDRSRYRNCYVLTFAILSLFPLIICISGNNWQEPMIVIIMAFLLSILIVPFFLIYNGFVMMRKEGRHLSQLLSWASELLSWRVKPSWRQAYYTMPTSETKRLF